MTCYYRNLAQLIQKKQEIIFLAPLSLRVLDFRNQNRNAREREGYLDESKRRRRMWRRRRSTAALFFSKWREAWYGGEVEPMMTWIGRLSEARRFETTSEESEWEKREGFGEFSNRWTDGKRWEGFCFIVFGSMEREIEDAGDWLHALIGAWRRSWG